MKKLVFMFMLILFIVSCNNDDENNRDVNIVGDWKLIEMLSDPGDGSGTYNAVDSDFVISFLDDGTFTANGDFCNMLDVSGSPSTGIYSEIESTITPELCEGSIPNWDYSFVINGDKLIIYFPCIEPCGAKYLKL